MALQANLFLHKGLEDEVSEIHAQLLDQESTTLRYHLARPRSTDGHNIPAIMQEMEKGGSVASFQKFGLPLVDIRVLEARTKFIDVLEHDGYASLLDEEKASVSDIEEISLYVVPPMVTFAFKTWVIANSKIASYRGILPFTKPVAKATTVLFKRSPTYYQHTVHCIELAAQSGKSPMYINTALWVLGMRM